MQTFGLILGLLGKVKAYKPIFLVLEKEIQVKHQQKKKPSSFAMFAKSLETSVDKISCGSGVNFLLKRS